MRIGCVSLIVSLLAAIPAPAQDPPLPLPVLPAATDTTALRAALRIPLDPPDYRFHFDDSGHFDVLDRSAEAPARIAEIKSNLKNNPSDAERYDELCLWQHRNGEPVAAKESSIRASRCYRERLRKDPYNADLLTRCGEALIEADDFPEAERRLRKAVAVDPHCWRAWFLLARVQIDTAYAMQALPAPRMADEPNRNARFQPPAPLNLPAELRADLPPAPEMPPPPEQVRPAGFQMPTRVVDWAVVAKLSGEAANCLDEALADAPQEPALRFARCCQRKLAAEVEMVTEGSGGPFDPFAIPENLADLHAAVNADTTDPEIISVATWFEILVAQKRLERADDPEFRRQTYTLVCERIEQLEGIAAKTGGPTSARAAVLAAHLCRKVGQPFRAGLQLRFAILADPESRPAWEAYLATLAETGPPSEYIAASRRAAQHFDTPPFILRLADALARSGDTAEALHVLDSLEHRDPDNVPAQLAEAALRLQSEGAPALPRVGELLDAAESTLRTLPSPMWQTECALLRANAQLIGGNAILGRMMLQDLAKREPWHPRVKAALAAVE